MDSVMIGWTVTYALNIITCLVIFSYCGWRYFHQPSRFNMALLAEPALALLVLFIKIGFIVNPDNPYICGDNKYINCLNASSQFLIMAQLVHLWMMLWKLQIIKSILIWYNHRSILSIGGVGLILCIYASIGNTYVDAGPAIRAANGLFFGFVVICDVSFFILIVASIRRYTKMKREVLNLESTQESVRVQLFLVLALASIIVGGVLFGISQLNQFVRDALSNWMLTIQIIGTYYYFYNVALVLSGRKASNTGSKHQKAVAVPGVTTPISDKDAGSQTKPGSIIRSATDNSIG